MDQNIAELLKDAFSEIDIDFEHLKSEEGMDPSQTPEDLGDDIEDAIGSSKLWTSNQGSDETFTNVYEQEESDASSDNSESEADYLVPINKESIFFPSDEIDNNQVVNTMMAETQQLNDTTSECTAEEGNMHSDLEAGVSEKELTEEEHIQTLKAEYEPQISPPAKSSTTSDEISSESDDEVQENYSTAKTASSSEFVDKTDALLLATSPRDDMKEFTEEDQEQSEESLADYPSDLSNSETEEPSANSRAQSDRMEKFSNAENLQNKDSPELDYNSEINIMEDHLNSASSDVDLSFQKETFAEKDVQEYLIDDRITEDDINNDEDTAELSNANDSADDTSDGSSDDDQSSCQEEANSLSIVKQEKEKNHVIQHSYSSKDMPRVDDDTEYICKDSDDLDARRPEKNDVEQLLFCNDEKRGFTNTGSSLNHEESNTESNNSIESLLWSSSLLMDEDNLHFEEYDWDLTGDETFTIHLDEGEHQEYTEEALEELNMDDDDEENKRDWELEKTRIEAFYQFYGDQAEPEVKVERNHKVTFCLDSSSSECDTDSDSTGEELDSDLNTPDLNTLKQKYHSESDEDLLEKPYYTEIPNMQPKNPPPADAPVKHPPYRNKCLAALKSTFAFGLMTAIGIASFWWATENMDRIH